MGVRGLATYIDKNQDVLRECQLRDSPLVIDGNNLYYALYHGLKTGHASNGDYDAFAKLIRKFFYHLRECDIIPYVVLGSWECLDANGLSLRLQECLRDIMGAEGRVGENAMSRKRCENLTRVVFIDFFFLNAEVAHVTNTTFDLADAETINVDL